MAVLSEVACNASKIGIGAVLNQERYSIAFSFFSENLNNAKHKYSTYDKEFYVIIRAFSHWQYYLLSNEFVLYSDHQALKYIQSQKMLTNRHVA